jgi:GT2 family glycosyltransferase
MAGTVRPRIRAVVLNWNGGDHVVTCIEHLLGTEWPVDRLEIVMLDNASSDGSDALVADRFGDRVRVVPTGGNLGFVANNLALRDLAGIDYVAMVNNDAFVEPGWLAPLVAALDEDPGLGAACPRILFASRFHEVRVRSAAFSPPGDGRSLGVRVREVATGPHGTFAESQFVKGGFACEPDVDGRPFRWLTGDAVIRVAVHPEEDASDFGFVDLELAAEEEKEVELSCGRYRATVRVGTDWTRVRVPFWQRPFSVVNNVGGVVIEDGFGADRGYLQIDDGRFDQPCEVFNWCGGGVLLRPAYLDHVGLLDERFFLYYEDTDLSWRGQHLGWRYRYVPESVVRHLHAASSGESSTTFQFYVERNRLLALTKNAPAGLAVRSVVGSATATLSYARRDVLPPLRRLRRPPLRFVYNRARSFASYLRYAPAMLVERRRLGRARTVPAAQVSARLTTRESWSHDERTVIDLAGWTIGAAPQLDTVGSSRQGAPTGAGRT